MSKHNGMGLGEFEMVGTAEAAKLLGISPQTIRNMIRRGTLTGYRRPGYGLKVFIPKKDVTALQTFEQVHV